MSIRRHSRAVILILLITAVVGCGTDKSAEPQFASDKDSARVPLAESTSKSADTPKSTTTPEGWTIIKSPEFECTVGWPENEELSNESNIDLDDGKLSFFFGTFERTEDHKADYSTEAIQNLTVMANRVGDENLLSNTYQKGQVYIKNYGNKNDEMTLIGRIVVGEGRYWSLVAICPNGDMNDDRIKYFFDNFELHEGQ